MTKVLFFSDSEDPVRTLCSELYLHEELTDLVAQDIKTFDLKERKKLKYYRITIEEIKELTVE